MPVSWLLIMLLLAGCSGTVSGFGEDMQRAGAKLSGQPADSPPPPPLPPTQTYGNRPYRLPPPHGAPGYNAPAYNPPGYDNPGRDGYPQYDDRQ